MGGETRIKTTGSLTVKVKICTTREATNTVKRHHGITKKKSLCKSLPKEERKTPLLYRESLMEKLNALKGEYSKDISMGENGWSVSMWTDTQAH